jgi:DNA-binding transcriptional MerR regulator
MADAQEHVVIPNRALFKAAEVCDLAKVPAYVLRSWEAEFPALGVAKSAGSPRVYRRADVEQVLRIKHLLRVEGLTLSGARRRIEEEATPVAADAPVIDELIGRNARERLTYVKRTLRSILEMLSGSHAAAQEFRLASPRAIGERRPPSRRPGRAKPSRGKAASGRNGSARRKRSA